MEGVNTVSENTVSEKHPGGAPKGKRNARKHGLNTLKAAVTELGSRAIPGNTKLGVCAAEKFRQKFFHHGSKMLLFKNHLSSKASKNGDRIPL